MFRKMPKLIPRLMLPVSCGVGYYFYARNSTAEAQKTLNSQQNTLMQSNPGFPDAHKTQAEVTGQNTIQESQDESAAQTQSQQHKQITQQQQKKEQPKQEDQNLIEQQQYHLLAVPAAIKDIPELDFKRKFKDDQYVIVISDMPYAPKFQKEILERVQNVLNNRKSSKPIRLYRVDPSSEGKRDQLASFYEVETQEETIFFLKNPFQNKLISFNFNLYIQYPHLLTIYLDDLEIVDRETYQASFQQKLKNIPDNQTYLLMLWNDQKADEFQKKKLAAKYIEMELGFHKLNEGVKLILIEQKLAKQEGILNNPTSSGLHLVRKSNDFTYATPNRYLYDNIPFHVLENISLYSKENKDILIPKHLAKIQTFNSMNIAVPYFCYIMIDRNKIQPWEQQDILRTFASLKKQKKFPFMSYIIQFGQIQYAGKDEDPYRHNRWMIKVRNIQKLGNESLVYDAKEHSDLDKIGVSQREWQKNTYQYLYRYPQVNENHLAEFIGRVMEEKEPQFYRTQKLMKLQSISKLSSENFNREVVDNLQKRSHLVFEYSDHCSSCQILSPAIQYLNQIFKAFPDININLHAINCDKNRVKGQPYSPYTPNLYYYSKNWKNKWPLRYPILDYMNSTGIKGVYDYCQITEELQSVKQQAFKQHIRNVKNNPIRIEDFV